METVVSPEAMIAWAEEAKAAGSTIGLVPTMGYLHKGHTSLMQVLRSRVDRLVVSIYVNPLQFGAGEDLERYPRDPEGDARRCEEMGVDCVFMPEDFYPDGFRTSVSIHGLTDGLCGASRPTHFEGVTTVVARLFGVTRCDAAIFGEKDYQQLVVLQRMVRDLSLGVTIVPAPIVRDSDGVALSSRNAYLSDDQRERAGSLHRSLRRAAEAVQRGETEVEGLLNQAASDVDADRIDYLSIVDAEHLVPIDVIDRPARILVAAFFGATRLIDNMALGPERSWI